MEFSLFCISRLGSISLKSVIANRITLLRATILQIKDNSWRFSLVGVLPNCRSETIIPVEILNFIHRDSHILLCWRPDDGFVIAWVVGGVVDEIAKRVDCRFAQSQVNPIREALWKRMM